MSERSLSPRELLDALGHGGVLRAPETRPAYVHNPVPDTKRWAKGPFVAPSTISALWQKQYLEAQPGHDDWFTLSAAGKERLAWLEGQDAETGPPVDVDLLYSLAERLKPHTVGAALVIVIPEGQYRIGTITIQSGPDLQRVTLYTLGSESRPSVPLRFTRYDALLEAVIAGAAR
jgi:hypothetical protein